MGFTSRRLSSRHAHRSRSGFPSVRLALRRRFPPVSGRRHRACWRRVRASWRHQSLSRAVHASTPARSATRAEADTVAAPKGGTRTRRLAIAIIALALIARVVAFSFYGRNNDVDTVALAPVPASPKAVVSQPPDDRAAQLDVALRGLERGPTCADRKKAIAKLVQLGDATAVPRSRRRVDSARPTHVCAAPPTTRSTSSPAAQQARRPDLISVEASAAQNAPSVTIDHARLRCGAGLRSSRGRRCRFTGTPSRTPSCSSTSASSSRKTCCMENS